MGDKVIFGQTFEGLYRAFQKELSPEDVVKLRGLGVDFQKPLLPAYPLSVWYEVLPYVSARMAPGLPQNEQVYRAACRFIQGFEQTVIGKAAFALLRILGPARALQRIERQFRNGNNYSQTSLTAVSGSEFVLRCNEVRWPGWYQGIVTEGLKLAGAKAPQVDCTQHDADGATFRVTWRA